MKQEDVEWVRGIIVESSNEALANFSTTPERVKALGLECDDMCYKIAEFAKEELDRRSKEV